MNAKPNPDDRLTGNLEAEAAAEAGARSVGDVEVEVKIKPPPKFVHTVRELIYWEYAKLIAKGAGFDGNYGFTTKKFNELRDGKIKMSGIDADNRKQMSRERKCEYCGATGVPLTEDHLIPMVKLVHDGTDNIVLACKPCNSSKGDRDIFDWYYNVRHETEIPKMVWSKYLKLVLAFHTAFRTLDKTDITGDGVLNILDLGAIFRKYPR